MENPATIPHGKSESLFLVGELTPESSSGAGGPGSCNGNDHLLGQAKETHSQRERPGGGRKTDGPPIDHLDHSSRLPCFGSKMGIDATTKTLAEGFTRPWPNEIKMDAETKARIDALWPKLGLPS